MSDLREQIAELINQYGADNGHIGWLGRHTSTYIDCADAILALIPKPSVRVKCGECQDGRGKCNVTMICPSDITYPEHSGICRNKSCTDWRPCPSCTDGGNEHEIVWVIHHCGRIDKVKPLTLPDLIDRDVREAEVGLQWVLDTGEKGSDFVTISHNKGTLRIGEKVK